MSHVMKGISIGVLVSVGLSCDPRSFDDLADTTWVQFAERDDSQVPGRFAVAVATVAMPSGQSGARFIVSSKSPAGLTQVTFDASGSKSQQIGSSIGASLAPLVTDSAGSNGNNILALAGTTDGAGAPAFVAGQFQSGMIGRAALMAVGLQNTGTPLTPPTSLTQDNYIQYGYSVAAGNLGTTGTARGQDIAVLSNNALTIFPGNGSATKACNLQRSNAPTNAYDGSLNSLVIAKVKPGAGTVGQVLVAVNAVRAGIGNNTPEILILDAADIVDGAHCPETKGVIIDANGMPSPSAIVVGDFDGNGSPDIAYSQTFNTGSGNIGVFMNITDFTGATPTKITPMPADIASAAFGSVLAAADLDDDTTVPGQELIIGDPGAQPKNVINSGQVTVLKIGATCPGGATSVRGPFCVLTTLYNPDPSANGGFGQAIVSSHYPTPTDNTSVLAIAEQNKLWVYFRTVASAPDPRQ